MIGAIIIGAILVIGLSVMQWDYQLAIRDGNWHFYNSRYMRRRIGGEWQYRPTTESEALDWMDMHAW